MHLTTILSTFGRSAGGGGRKFQGFQWIGKHRRPHRITLNILENYKKRVQAEERNLFYLRHPYLTVEQERGYSKELKKSEKWWGAMRVEASTDNLKRSTRIEENLAHLNSSNKWEL